MAQQPYEISFRHEANGADIEGGDGPTVLMTKRLSPIGCGLVVLAIAAAPTAAAAWFEFPSGALIPGSPVPISVGFLVGAIVMALAVGLYTHMYNQKRRPLLVIDHACREVRLPKDRLVIPFADVQAVHLLVDFARDRGESGTWFFDLGLLAGPASAPPRRHPFCTLYTAVGVDPEAIAARLAEELGVPLQEWRDPAYQPDDLVSAMRAWRKK